MANPIPLKVNRFKLDIGGVSIGAFHEMSGLEFKIEPSDATAADKKDAASVQAVWPGLPKTVRQLTFKTTTISDELWRWLIDAWQSPPNAISDGSVTLMDHDWKEVVRINVHGIWPQKVSFSALNVKSSDPVELELTFQAEYLKIN